MIVPAKLQEGDEVRIVAPSRSMATMTKDFLSIAEGRFEKLGLKVTYGKRVNETGLFGSAPIESRVADLHEAFTDPNVKGIFTIIGGFNVNQILSYLDYDLIKANPKILCGFSDITALQNAVYTKTGLVTYSGVHFSSFSMKQGFDYSMEHFQKMLMEDKPVEIVPSPEWSDDAWYKDQEAREFIPNEGYWIVNEGSAEGVILGGNQCTFQLLHGTEFMPNLEGSILFLEEDAYTEGCDDVEFERNLQSIIHQPNFDKVKGLVIGRFQKKSEMTFEKMRFIIDSKRELRDIPIIANADFGHTTPIFTFPIGGKGWLSVKGTDVKLQFG